MEMYYSDDSEFDNDAIEQEIELYSKLYFEPEVNHHNAQYSEKSTNISDSKNLRNGCAIEHTVTKLLSNNLQSHSNLRTLSNMDHENRKRKRNTSLCSIGSISGSEPLDNLYCILSSDNECNMEVIPEVSLTSLDESNLDNSKYHHSDDESRCNMFLNKKSNSSNKNILNVSSLSYTELRNKTISKNEIEILKCVKKGNLSSNKLARKVNDVIVLSSDNSGSDTDDSKEFYKAARLSTPLTLNISSNSNTTYSKQNRKSKFFKSKIIYSQTKPLTQRLPSCPKWTQEMAGFYDSDISVEFSVEGIHESQTDLRRYWKICPEDFTVYRPKRRRYYDERCSRCREFGHNVKNCPRKPHCRFCCSTKHTNVFFCPDNCCLRCGRTPHGFCYLTSFQRVCNNCGNKGHDSTLCPDTWRRYHITAQGSRPVVPDKTSLKIKPKKVYCYNCSKTGHFGHQCRSTGVKQYPPLSTKIFSYETLMKPNSTAEVHEDDSIVAVKNPKIYEDYKENEFIRTSLYFPRKVVMNLTKEKCSLLRTVQMLSEAQLDSQLSGRKNNRIIVTGTSKSILEARRLINIINSKCPYKEYKKLILLSKKNKEEILSSKKTSSEHSPKKDSVTNEIEIFNPNKEMVEVTQNSCNKTSCSIITIDSEVNSSSKKKSVLIHYKETPEENAEEVCLQTLNDSRVGVDYLENYNDASSHIDNKSDIPLSNIHSEKNKDNTSVRKKKKARKSQPDIHSGETDKNKSSKDKLLISQSDCVYTKIPKKKTKSNSKFASLNNENICITNKKSTEHSSYVGRIKSEDLSSTTNKTEVVLMQRLSQKRLHSSAEDVTLNSKKKKKKLSIKKEIPSHSDRDTLETTNEAIDPSIIKKEKVITSSSIIKEEGEILPYEPLSSSTSKEALEIKDNIELVQETDSSYGLNCKHRLYISAEAPLDQKWKNSRYLRIPCPQTKNEAIRTFKKVLRHNKAGKLRIILKQLTRLVGFFRGNYSVKKDRFVWGEYQQLSRLLFSNLRVGPGPGWMNSLRKLVANLMHSENTLIEPELYKRMSDLYLKVVDPPLEKLGEMLNLADDQISILKERLLKLSKRNDEADLNPKLYKTLRKRRKGQKLRKKGIF